MRTRTETETLQQRQRGSENLLRDANVFEDDGAGAGAALAHHVLLLAERETRRAARQEKRGEGHVGGRVRVLMRAREHQVPFCNARVRNPHLWEQHKQRFNSFTEPISFRTQE